MGRKRAGEEMISSTNKNPANPPEADKLRGSCLNPIPLGGG